MSGRGRTINMSIVWSTVQWLREKVRVVALSKHKHPNAHDNNNSALSSILVH